MKYKMTYPQECWVDSYFIKTQYSDAVANGEIDWEHLAIDEDDLESIIQALNETGNFTFTSSYYRKGY
jgi:hypothetical protein